MRGFFIPGFIPDEWGGRWGSNPRQPESQSGALPAELRPPLIVLSGVLSSLLI